MTNDTQEFRVSGKTLALSQLVQICQDIDEAAVAGSQGRYNELVRSHGYDIAMVLLQILQEKVIKVDVVR